MTRGRTRDQEEQGKQKVGWGECGSRRVPEGAAAGLTGIPRLHLPGPRPRCVSGTDACLPHLMKMRDDIVSCEGKALIAHQDRVSEL